MAGQAAEAPKVLVPLVERARQGDRDAFAALYRRRVTSIYRFAMSSLRDTAAAEDATALTFLRAWEKLPSLRQPERFDSWLFQIAHRQIVDQTRIRRHEPLETAGDPLDPEPAHAPLQIVLLRERRARVLRLLHTVSAEQRRVLVLRFLHDLTPRETAQALGKSEVAVRALQHRALLRLRAVLEDADPLSLTA